METLQRLIFLCILVVCLFKIAGDFPMFKIQQWMIHEKMNALIKDSLKNDFLPFVPITFQDVTHVRWEREGKEFWYKGNLYDVVFLEVKNEVVTYYCLEDKEETQLCHHFYESVQADQNNSETPNHYFFKKNLPIYFLPIVELLVENKPQYELIREEKPFPTAYKNVFCSCFLEKIDPPPQFSL